MAEGWMGNGPSADCQCSTGRLISFWKPLSATYHTPPLLCSEPLDRATFLRNLWWIFDKLEEKASDDSGKPAYFRFLTLLCEWQAAVAAGWAAVIAHVRVWQD